MNLSPHLVYFINYPNMSMSPILFFLNLGGGEAYKVISYSQID